MAVDAIILATPTHTHIAMAKVLVGSGLSILIEKPLATTGDEGRRFLESCKADPRGVYMVGHHRRHNCHVRAIKDVLDKGELGVVVAVNGGEAGILRPFCVASMGDSLTLISQSGRSASQTDISTFRGTGSWGLAEWYEQFD